MTFQQKRLWTSNIIGILVFIFFIFGSWYAGVDFSERGILQAVLFMASVFFGLIAALFMYENLVKSKDEE